MSQGWITPKARKGLPSGIHGLGLFSVARIDAGEVVAVKGGNVVDSHQLVELADVVQHSELQIAEDLFLAPLNFDEHTQSMLYVNHSCEPNLYIEGQIVFVAARVIEPNEELTIDYATIFDRDGQFECSCGAESCRHLVTGKDWQLQEMQDRYVGHFSSFIERQLELE